MDRIPLIDLVAQYRQIKEEIDKTICGILERGAFTTGEYIKKFQEEFAKYCGRKYGVGVASGSAALDLILMALELKGKEIITTPFTFIATTEAITHAGAKIKFVDCEEKTFCIDPNLIEKAITKDTKAIIFVDLYGHPADIDPILEICDKYGLYAIEDAAQAHGAEYKGKKCGSFGIASCFSFYPSKNLNAYGHAGMVLTDDKELADKINLLQNHGRTTKYEHYIEGYNLRMDDLQAAILLVKLKYLDEWNEKRRRAAKLYTELLKDLPDVILPREADYAKHVYHLYVIRAKDRDKLMKYLNENGISALVHYPIPLHLQPAYKYLGYKEGDFPVAEKLAKEVLSLPMYPEITEEQIHFITDKIKEFYS